MTAVSSQPSGLVKRGHLPLESYPGRGISDGAYRDKEETLAIESSVLTSFDPTVSLKTKSNWNGRIEQPLRILWLFTSQNDGWPQLRSLLKHWVSSTMSKLSLSS